MHAFAGSASRLPEKIAHEKGKIHVPPHAPATQRTIVSKEVCSVDDCEQNAATFCPAKSHQIFDVKTNETHSAPVICHQHYRQSVGPGYAMCAGAIPPSAIKRKPPNFQVAQQLLRKEHGGHISHDSMFCTTCYN